MSVSMEGRVAYISGGSCMMARGTATAFLEAGGKVVLGDMKQELLDAAKADLVSKGFAAENIATAIVNVTDWDSIRSSFDQAEAAFGTVDVLVNIAGIIVAYYRLDDMKEEDWDLTFDVNVKGLINLPVLNETTASAGDILTGKTAYSGDYKQITGTIPNLAASPSNGGQANTYLNNDYKN